jgi:hypothetical protein
VGDTTVLDLGNGAIPRWWTDGADTFLVWGTSAEDNTASDWGSGQTKAQQWSNGGLTGSVQTWAPGSYHDGRSGQYLYGGYRRLKQYNLGSGTSKILFTYPQDGKAVGDTSQACNASAAPDGSGRSLFLDFGYSGTSTVVGRPYGIHEIAFEADSSGNVIQTFPVAGGKLEWDHLRWSNDAQWAAGVAVERNGAYKEIHLLDLSTGNTIPILSGQELWMPGLWVGKTGGIDTLPSSILDSAAEYDTPVAGLALETFAVKTVTFWRDPSVYQTVFVGSSRTCYGLDAKSMSTPSFNFGVIRGEMVTQDRIIRDYVLPHCQNLHGVVLCLMPGWMWSHRTDFSWNDIQAGVGYNFDRNHGFWSTGIPQWLPQIASTKKWPSSLLTDSLGTMLASAGSWEEGSLGSDPPVSESFDDTTFQANWKTLVDLVAELDSRNIQVLLVNFPVSPGYEAMGYVDLYGPTISTYEKLVVMIEAVEAQYPHFHFYDANMYGKHDYVDSMAANQDHLAPAGAQLLTARVDSVLGEWEAKQAQ